MTLLSASEAQTLMIARRLAAALPGPVVVLLVGELGAGKTAFTRGFLEGLDAADSRQVHSPTFTLVNEYRSPRGKVYHVDLYRLESERDFRSIGLEEILDAGCWVLVEWADKLPRPVSGAIRVELRQQDDDTREIEIQGLPDKAAARPAAKAVNDDAESAANPFSPQPGRS